MNSAAGIATRAKAAAKYKLKVQTTVEGRGMKSATTALSRARREGMYVELCEDEWKSIRNLYIHKQFLNSITGIEHHVDHIIPKRHGGMHTRANLQILTKEEHKAKSIEEDQNRYVVVIEGIQYPSQMAASRAHGCSALTVKNRVESKTKRFSGWQRGTS